MTSELMGKALLEALPRSELQQLAKKEGIKANSKSTVIIQGLLKKYPKGIPRNGAPKQPSKALEEIIQPKGESGTLGPLATPSGQNNEPLEPPSPKRRKVVLRSPSGPAPIQKEEFTPDSPAVISVSGGTTSRVNGANKRVSHVGAQPDADSQPVPVAEERQHLQQNKRRRDTPDDPPADTTATASPAAQRPQKGLSPKKRKLIPSGKEVRLIRRELTGMSTDWPRITGQLSEMQMALDDDKRALTKCEKGVGDMSYSADFLEGYAGLYKTNRYLWDGSWNLNETDRARWEQYNEVNDRLKESGEGQMSALMADVKRAEKWDPAFWTIHRAAEEQATGRQVEISWAGPGKLFIPRSRVKF